MTTEQALAAPAETAQEAPPIQEAPLEAPAEETPAPETPVEGEDSAEQSQEERQEVELPEGWDAHPDVEKRSKESHAAGYQEAQSHFEKLHTREKRQLEADNLSAIEAAKTEALSSAVVQNVGQAAQAISRKLQREGMTAAEATEAVRDLLDENAEWARVFDDDRVKQAQKNGEKAGEVRQLSESSTWLYAGLSDEQRNDLSDFVVDNLNLELQKREITPEQAFQKMLQKRDELVLKAAEPGIEKLVTERVTSETKADERNGKSPPVKPTGRGGTATATPRTKQEARALHVQDKISSAEMRRINSDPSIPEN